MPAFTLTAYGKAVPVPEARLEVVPAGTPGVRAAPTLLLGLPKDDLYVGQTLRIPVSLLDPGDGSVQSLSGARIIGESVSLRTRISTGPALMAPSLLNGQAYAPRFPAGCHRHADSRGPANDRWPGRRQF